jgi:hypothetical protein
MDLFKEFHQGSLLLHRLNFGNIILLPKKKNISFKTFTKVATNRLTTVAQNIISPTQTAFLPGRNIMEVAVILRETLHELNSKKQDGIILKLDFEKAYDKVNWNFLQQTLRMKGSPKRGANG